MPNKLELFEIPLEKLGVGPNIRKHNIEMELDDLAINKFLLLSLGHMYSVLFDFLFLVFLFHYSFLKFLKLNQEQHGLMQGSQNFSIMFYQLKF